MMFANLKQLCCMVIVCTMGPTACSSANPTPAVATSPNQSSSVSNNVPATTGAGTSASNPNNATTTATSTNNANVDQIVQVANDFNAYTLVGRFDFNVYGAPFFSYETSKIGARFSGTQLVLQLADDGTDLYQIELDGNVLPNALKTYQVSNLQSPNTFVVAQNLNNTIHTVWITKMTEFMQGSQVSNSDEAVGHGVFYGLILSPNASFYTPPSRQTHILEALGDSGFTGYGVLDTTDPNCVFSPETEDGTQSIPAMAAKALKAGVVNLSASGQGIYSSAYQSADSQTQLPLLYPYTAPYNTTPLWPFTTMIADVVVINGGGDDLVGPDGSGSLPNPNAFVSTYAQLLATIRGHYPNALILAAISPQATGNDNITLTQSIGQAVASRQQAGDTNVLLYNFFTGTPYTDYDDAASNLNLDYGCEGHPGPLGSAYLGGQLANFIQSKMNW